MLKSVIEALSDQYPDSEAVLFVGSCGSGVLSSVDIRLEKYFYRRSRFKSLQLVIFFLSQMHLFLRLAFSEQSRKSDVVYVNTVLPFGAAVFGKLFRKKVIYHIHEVSIKPASFFRFLLGIANRMADQQIYVSNMQLQLLMHGQMRPNVSVIRNCVSPELFRRAEIGHRETSGQFRILMLSSLREYKGIWIFVELAKRFVGKEVQWILLANEREEVVDEFRNKVQGLSNLRVFNGTKDPSDFYLYADLVLNLSIIGQFTESFGLTVAEAFVFGIPVIAPPCGGPAEIVVDGINGYLVDSRDVQALVTKVTTIVENAELHRQLSLAARTSGQLFSPVVFRRKLIDLVGNLRRK